VRARMYSGNNLQPEDVRHQRTPKSLIVDVNNELVGNQRRNADTTLQADERNLNGNYAQTTRVEPLFLQIPASPTFWDNSLPSGCFAPQAMQFVENERLV